MRRSTARRGSRRRCFVALVVVAVVAVGVGSSLQLRGSPPGPIEESEEVEGLAEREPVTHRPTVEAAFAAESYRPGVMARLVLFDDASTVTLRLYRVGDAPGVLRARDVMRGKQVGATRRLARVSRGQAIPIRVGSRWPSGLYYAQLNAPRNRVGYAPFVLAPRRLGGHRVAVVMPTQTWQAYNFRDDDGNGTGDSWYASPGVSTARLHRPFENRGVPGHYRYYDEPFLRWLDHNDYPVDFLSDAELKATSGRALARAYELIVFPGHHEYVTAHEFDAVTDFRDRGGNLMFLSANNFYYEITIAGDVMTRIDQWRDLGRPEAALVGVGYFDYDAAGRGGSPWTLRRSTAGRWIFRGTGLRPGSPFSSGGIEADHTSSASPPGTQIIAEIVDVFGSGRNAQMTYYRAPSGSRVFAAGAFSLACSVWQPPVQQMMANLFNVLAPSASPLRIGGEPAPARVPTRGALVATRGSDS